MNPMIEFHEHSLSFLIGNCSQSELMMWDIDLQARMVGKVYIKLINFNLYVYLDILYVKKISIKHRIITLICDTINK